MLRGREILQTITEYKTQLDPYFSAIVKTVSDAMPRLANPEESYWLYQGELPSLRGAVVSTTDILGTIHPNYLLVAVTVVFVLFVLYIKMKYPFWNQIPALHVYDWHRRFVYSEKPYIVHLLPKRTKYYEPRWVETGKFKDLDESRKTEIAKLLQNNYLPSDRVFCSVQVPDLVAQCSDALVSFYNRVEKTVTETAVIEIDRQIEGVITSRRINTAISLGESKDRYVVQEPAEYIDYLCFARGSITPLKTRHLFHTHEFNQRLVMPERNITLFKREVELCDAIVPLVEYESLTFYLRFRIEPVSLSSNFQIVRIQREHLRHLHDWMERVASLREDTGIRVSITAEIGDLIHLLQTNQMFAYALRGMDSVYALYFFRNAHMKYEDLEGGDTLHSVAAFCNTNDFELYFQGFVWAVREARKDLSGSETKMLMVDDIGQLRGVAKRWTDSHDVVLRTKTAYYFCNYIVPRSPYRAEDVNVLI